MAKEGTKSLTDVENEANKLRKAKVDRENAKKVKMQADKEEAEANIPLTAEEQSFIVRIKPRLNAGRAVDQPSSAEIVRFSRLIKREKIT